VAALDSENINCDTAEQVDYYVMRLMDNISVSDVVLRKVNQARTLSSLCNKVTVDKKLAIDSTIYYFLAFC